MGYLFTIFTLHLSLAIYSESTYGLATVRSRLSRADSSVQRVTVDSPGSNSKLGTGNGTVLDANLHLRWSIARPITQCPGGDLPAYYNTFIGSFCGFGREPREYTVVCRSRMGPQNHGIRWNISSYFGDCFPNEVCFDTSLGMYGVAFGVAFCINAVNLALAYKLSPGQSGISGPNPPELIAVPQLDRNSLSASFQLTGPDTHRFEVALTGHDTQDSMYWAQHMRIQPKKEGKSLGSPMECDDCVRKEVMSWPRDADGFEIGLVKKNPSDTVTVNWVRLFLPYS